MTEKTYYLVDTGQLTLVGKYDELERADAAGAAEDIDYDIIASDEDFSKRYTAKQLVSLFNNAAGEKLVKFPNKDEAMRRVLLAFNNAEVKIVAASKKKAPSKKSAGAKPKKERKPKEVKPKAEPGYRGHRNGSRKEQAHIYFDKTKNLTRKAFIEHLTTELQIAETTAASWYQAFRHDALTS